MRPRPADVRGMQTCLLESKKNFVGDTLPVAKFLHRDPVDAAALTMNFDLHYVAVVAVSPDVDLADRRPRNFAARTKNQSALVDAAGPLQAPRP